ncbi:MAG TPA: GNAT family N-acetyltransferase [Polyangiaceae bacterium]|jgi:predicted acetyltransferase|nr:GNAT family N-acetyltransferase [Polyangiaceae bacterium]
MPADRAPESQSVALERALPSDSPLLANLLELYIHDLSPAFPQIQLGPDGRFGYSRLPLYWAEPERRFAYFIRRDGRLAGFALASRGSPVVDDPEVLDVQEFFVLRSERRFGVGRAAAFQLWRALPGNWIVRVSEGVPDSVKFWRTITTEFSHGAVKEWQPGGEWRGRRVFSFESRG